MLTLLRRSGAVRCVAALSLILCLASPLFSQQAQAPPSWDKWTFIIGDWVGEGGGGPGQGTGTFSFSLDLAKQILVRKNHSDYPASGGRPAYSHDDLMIIYQDPPGTSKAIYFDTEGHVINYKVDLSTSGDSVTFLSDAASSAPRFRLSYKKSNSGLDIKFEIAPPGKPDGFSTYIEARARRK